MEQLRESLREGRFILDLDEADTRSIFQETVQRLVSQGSIPADLADRVLGALIRREEENSTALGRAIAVPHAYLEGFSEPMIVLVRLARPVNLGSPDGIPTQLLFFLLGPPGAPAKHLDTLANIARLGADDQFRFDAQVAKDQRELLNALDSFIRRTAVPLERAPKPDEGLEYTGKLFGGLRDDMRRRGRQYISDFRDGLHTKCVGSTLFLFFACLAPAVTFGGVMSAQTGGQIGAVEMILASAACGVAYALMSGQPLIILGGTGPLLVFTAVLYRLCQDMGVAFLPAYAWVGLWSALLLMILSATDASCLMRYFTRFTDEIFAALISLIFIYEAIKALVDIFHGLDVRQHHDTALLSLLLALGTFYVATNLSGMRRSRFLLPKIREFMADFGPTIALASMTAVAAWMHAVDLDVLPVPDSFDTTTGRSWLLNPLEAPTWVRFAAIGPAILATVLVYLDQNITARIVNSADHNLKKGPAYHLDLAIVGILMGVCSLFGLPWLVAATVRSINHVRSLATVEESAKADGTRRERIIHVREQRVTALGIHMLIGLSLVLLPVLKLVPMAVLYGLFLFMGVVSMSGNQFFERLSLWVMDSRLYPTTHYTRRVPMRVIHKFTFLQFVCLVVLWVVKVSAMAIVFPLFIALLVPVRLMAGRFFAPHHLTALDAETEWEEEETHWTV